MTESTTQRRETFVEETDDWVDALTGDFRTAFLDKLRSLPVKTARRFPPPKLGRIPFGHEVRVLRRFLAGESTLFDPSAFSALYHRMASDTEQRFYRAFILHETLPREEWMKLIGESALSAWTEHGMLREADGGLRSRFGVYSIGEIFLIGDPFDSNLLRRVLVGQDSFMMANFMTERRLPRCQRYLDVGPGSGVILLTVSPLADECVGLDINPRAVKISRLNAELNRISHCSVHLEDAIANGTAHGTFDLVTWNTPFVYLPEECKDTHYDGYGGELGMEVLQNFLGVLPALLRQDGRAFLAAAAPILRSGENLLEERLSRIASESGMHIREHITQDYWHTIYRDFQEQQGIRKFEHSFLEIQRGPARLERVEAPLTTRLSDAAREFAFRVWK